MSAGPAQYAHPMNMTQVDPTTADQPEVPN